jgi:hypothetical protein
LLEKREPNTGIVVIANKEGVYADPAEPAKRRRIDLGNNLGNQVVIRRSSAQSLRLFDSATGGNEKMAGANEALIAPGTYWLEGGITASTAARDQWLSVETLTGGAPTRLAVTVLWVDITGRIGVDQTYSPNPAFDGYDLHVTKHGHGRLGVQLDDPGPTTNPYSVPGMIEIQGDIIPNNLKPLREPSAEKGAERGSDTFCSLGTAK